MNELFGKTVFVTGGSGFIGTRLIETLALDHGANVIALVNNANAGALRMTRFNIKLVFGDIRDSAEMKAATSGAEIIIHMAYGRSGNDHQQHSVTVEGTASMVDAALKNGVSRFVNVGTAAVYFGAPDGIVDETFARRKWGWIYSDSKLEAEDIVREASVHRGLPGTIVQVAGVYGPWSQTFTVSPLMQLQTGRVVLINNGEGISNATYVDDAVQAILLAAVRQGAIGETFLIKGPGKITRLQLYAAYEKMLGYESHVCMTKAEIKDHQRKSAAAALRIAPAQMAKALTQCQDFKDAVKSLPIPGFGRELLKNLKVRKPSPSAATAGSLLHDIDKPIFFPPKFLIPYYAAKVEFSSSKAEAVLGYSPRHDLESGMNLTEKWARWARIIK